MQTMQQRTNAGVVLITHDLGVVAEVCDRVLVMYAGIVVESSTVELIFSSPQHPYTQALLESLPQMDDDRTKRLNTIPGQPPDLAHLPNGCPFYERCAKRMPDVCQIREPAPVTLATGQIVRCFLYGG